MPLSQGGTSMAMPTVVPMPIREEIKDPQNDAIKERIGKGKKRGPKPKKQKAKTTKTKKAKAAPSLKDWQNVVPKTKPTKKAEPKNYYEARKEAEEEIAAEFKKTMPGHTETFYKKKATKEYIARKKSKAQLKLDADNAQMEKFREKEKVPEKENDICVGCGDHIDGDDPNLCSKCAASAKR